MPRRPLAVPIYQDKRSGYWWADLRRYAHLGGKRHALGTQDPNEARHRCQVLVADFESLRLALGDGNTLQSATLGDTVGAYLVWRAEQATVSDRVIAEDQRHLEEAVAFFETDGPRLLSTIRPTDVEAYLGHLRRTIAPVRGETVAPATLRNRLRSLSGYFQWAQYRDYCDHNPVRALPRDLKPRPPAAEASFLQADDVALILAAMPYVKGQQDLPCQTALVYTFALTGGRRAEVLGLLVDDVDFRRKTLTFRPNGYRQLKTPRSRRVVPLWPQLARALREWIKQHPGGELLFPSSHRRVRRRDPQMIGDLRRLWERVQETSKWEPTRPLDPPRISSKAFRNAYAAQRLQTLDRGEPIQMYSVARELGHGSLSMLERVYAHLGDVRHRAPVVEYRTDDYPVARRKLAQIRDAIASPRVTFP